MTNNTAYTVPDDLANPEIAALELAPARCSVGRTRQTRSACSSRGGSEPLPGMEGVGGPTLLTPIGVSSGDVGGAVRSVTTPTREVGLLTAEGASDGRVEVVPPCCDLAVGDFEDTHDRHRYLDTVLTA
jgi:hypothetical protein